MPAKRTSPTAATKSGSRGVPKPKTTVRKPKTTVRKPTSPKPKVADGAPKPASGAVGLKGKSAARELFTGLQRLHPDAHCELNHRDAFELLVATVLSAQTTDKLVNQASVALFASYPDAQSLAKADIPAVAELLRSGGLGMYNQKGKNIVGLARQLVEQHSAEVPRTLSALVKLPGVGRKTANVVLGVMWGIPEGVVVDTHVMRLSQRLGLSKNTTPEEIEQDLVALFPRELWDPLSHTLIFHGRRICFARKPACSGCGVAKQCPSAHAAENVGRKPKKTRA